jgi:hypothetical protein
MRIETNGAPLSPLAHSPSPNSSGRDEGGAPIIPATFRRCFRWKVVTLSNASCLYCVLVRSANYALARHMEATQTLCAPPIKSGQDPLPRPWPPFTKAFVGNQQPRPAACLLGRLGKTHHRRMVSGRETNTKSRPPFTDAFVGTSFKPTPGCMRHPLARLGELAKVTNPFDRSKRTRKPWAQSTNLLCSCSRDPAPSTNEN